MRCWTDLFVPWQDLNYTDIEMPGQFQDGSEVVADSIVRLEAIGCDVVIVRRQGTAVRRLAFHGSNGKTRYFMVQCSQMYASGETLYSQRHLLSKLRACAEGACCQDLDHAWLLQQFLTVSVSWQVRLHKGMRVLDTRSTQLHWQASHS